MTADDLTFVDTDILVYAYDPLVTHKQPLAQALLERLWASRTGTLSTQILQEFHVVATRKFDPPMRRRAAREIVALYGEPGGRRMVEAPLRPLAGGRDGLTDLLVASLSTTIRSRCHPGPAAGAGRPSGPLNRSAEAEGRVDRPEESARDRCEPLRFAGSGFRRHRSPGAKRDRERDPWVAVVGVVFDEDQASIGAQVARGGQKPQFDNAAAPSYSWMSPPSRSRRRTSHGLAAIGSPAATSGEARPRARCGRCRL